MSDEKKLMIDELFTVLQEQGEQLQAERLDRHVTVERLDVLLDVMHFLQDYDENVKVLNDYWRKKRWKEKFKKYGERGDD